MTSLHFSSGSDRGKSRRAWYVGKISVGGWELKKIHHWVNIFMLHRVVRRHQITMEYQRLSVKHARQYCLEDVKVQAILRRGREAIQGVFRSLKEG